MDTPVPEERDAPTRGAVGLRATAAFDLPLAAFDALRTQLSSRLPTNARLHVRASKSADAEPPTHYALRAGQLLLEVTHAPADVLTPIFESVVEDSGLPLVMVRG